MDGEVRAALESIKEDTQDTRQYVRKLQTRTGFITAVASILLSAALGQCAADKNLQPNDVYVDELKKQGYDLQYEKTSFLVWGEGYYFQDKNGGGI